MRTLAEKPNSPQLQGSSVVARSKRALPHSRCANCDETAQRTAQPHAEAIAVEPISTVHDFSSIPVHAKTPARPQPKLTVSPANDSFEQEADAIADHVTRMADPASPPAPISRCAGTVHTKRHSGAAVSSTLSTQISSSLGGGSRMDPTTQDAMQRGFGADFSHVRIHADGAAAYMSRALGAHAFTVGRDIYFGSGAYAPDTTAGKHLLAHELTHTIQQGGPNAIQKQGEPRQQSERGLGVMNDEGRPEGGGFGVAGAEPVAAAERPEQIQLQIQRSTNWAGATVHETRNKAEDSLRGGAPVTWQMLNGTKLETEADADNSVKIPAISTSGSDKKWKAKVDTVPAQEGGDDETVLSPGPWRIVAPKTEIGARFGLAVCTGAGNSTFSALGKPSDDAVYKANRRHEDHHVADDKVAFEDTMGKWDKKVEEAKSKGTQFEGEDAAKAKAALWTAMGGEPKQVAREYRTLSFTKGGQFHGTPAGGPMEISNVKSNADCSTSSLEVTNPS